MNNLRILHCANFSTFKNGEAYYSMDRKISHGFIQNGHMVYEFSYRDIAKAQRFLGLKKRSIEKMNKDLVDHCINIRPNILLLGKCELVSLESLEKIKKLLPDIKIIQWYVDFINKENNDFFSKFKYIDVFLQTTGTGLLELSKKYKNTIFSYIPNITDPNFDVNIDIKKEYDVLYIARDHKEDNRYKFALLLNEFCKKENINLKMYGSLGNPYVFGNDYYKEISKARIAINFNREDLIDTYNHNKILGTSDRMNHFIGSKTCTFSPKIIDLDKLYKDNEHVVYFESSKECFEKLLKILNDESYNNIASDGQLKAYEISNSKRVTNYMLNLINNNEIDENIEWKDYVFYDGKKI
ncbi:hypothetical protein LPB137_09875 [Poseidonibacter parvus]|uniref:Spore protein YkvP/CgeB glycosyl transferase-like domain-containing protein n=1 Tax=Poseidonibacter parvus TaxID=1850254 RepID=A0A1P8KNL6_9BACT|nr:glycosyltransferase family 1 protein [Poseidonibacter parvus]APW66140.1 hypothetical protein LPB137_09875 [Poseidonibacter parvus]